jgi:hypothetical protein
MPEADLPQVIQCFYAENTITAVVKDGVVGSYSITYEFDVGPNVGANPTPAQIVGLVNTRTIPAIMQEIEEAQKRLAALLAVRRHYSQ